MSLLNKRVSRMGSLELHHGDVPAARNRGEMPRRAQKVLPCYGN